MRRVALMEWGSQMIFRRFLPLAGLMICAFGAQAAERLSCRVSSGHLPGAKHPAKIAEFAWNSAHGAGGSAGVIKTSIGGLGRGEGARHTTAITLNGKAVRMPPEAAGIIWGGKVYDFGQVVAVAYLVERQDDSSASPSEAVLVIRKGGTVSEFEVLPGTESAPPGHCALN